MRGATNRDVISKVVPGTEDVRSDSDGGRECGRYRRSGLGRILPCCWCGPRTQSCEGGVERMDGAMGRWV